MNIKTVLDNVNAIKEIADSIQNIELKSIIVDLKEQVLELKEENLNLKEKLSKQEDFNMIFEDNKYWNTNENNVKDGPYCPACWDNNKKTIRFNEAKMSFHCPVCKNTVSKNLDRPNVAISI
ncbi:MAG: hypothetical protein WCG23_10235 [bacterium]